MNANMLLKEFEQKINQDIQWLNDQLQNQSQQYLLYKNTHDVIMKLPSVSAEFTEINNKYDFMVTQMTQLSQKLNLLEQKMQTKVQTKGKVKVEVDSEPEPQTTQLSHINNIELVIGEDIQSIVDTKTISSIHCLFDLNCVEGKNGKVENLEKDNNVEVENNVEEVEYLEEDNNVEVENNVEEDNNVEEENDNNLETLETEGSNLEEEVEVEEEEEVKEEEVEDEEEEEVEEEEEEEVEEEEEEEVEVEVEVEEEEEEEVEEVEEVEEEEVEEEQVEEEEEDEELVEVTIKGVDYATNNEMNGIIYLLEDGEVGAKVGYFKNSIPVFTSKS